MCSPGGVSSTARANVISDWIHIDDRNGAVANLDRGLRPNFHLISSGETT